MTMLSLECSSCGKRLKAPESLLGKLCKCSACGAVLLLPELVDETEETPATTETTSRRRVLPWAAGGLVALGAVVLLASAMVGRRTNVDTKGTPAPAARAAAPTPTPTPTTAPGPATRPRPPAAPERRDEPPAPQQQQPTSPGPRDVPAPAAGNPADAEKVVRNYLRAKTWEDRLPYVMEPERVRPLMKARYEEHGLPTLTAITARLIERKTVPSEHLVVQGAASNGLGIRASYNFPVRQTRDGYKIDWEAAVGYNSTALRAFLIQRPQGATRFRLQCELGTFYHGEFFGCQGTHYSVRLKQEEPLELAHGFVPKDSAEGKKLFELLKDGKQHEMTVELQNVGPYGQPLERPDAGVVSIVRVVSESWVDR
jgi:hypothetical protein